MAKKNSVYIATSIDGFIADKNGGIEWLDMITVPEGEDMGYYKFMEDIDALVMGRNSFETVLGFDVDWPYTKPVYVLSNSLAEIPDSHREKAFHLKGELSDILQQIHQKGHTNLYIDGGITIQNFLRENLIDELIVTVIPIILGGGTPLYSKLPNEIKFELVSSKVYCDQLLQIHYKRKKAV
jgi:dihydrofolate reductase